MKIYGRIELPVSIEEAYQHLVGSIEQDEADLKITIRDRVGDLDKGTIIEQEFFHRGKKHIYRTRITENIRPHTFNQESLGEDIRMTYNIHLKSDGAHTVLESVTTYHLKFNLRSFLILLYSSRHIHARHFYDAKGWQHLFSDQVVRAKYWGRVGRVNHRVVSTPIWLFIFLIFGMVYGYLNPDVKAADEKTSANEKYIQTDE